MTTEEVYVNSFDNTTRQWQEIGITPFLHDTNDDYIQINLNLKVHSGWLFPNSGGSGAINSVKLRFEAMSNDPDLMDTASYSVWNGSAWSAYAPIVINTNNWEWFEKDVSAILDTWDKINVAKVRVRSSIAGGNTVMIRRLTRKIDYTEAAGAVLRRNLVGVGL